MYVPLLGRLSLLEWPVILTSFFLAWIEYISSLITRLLPTPIITIFTHTLQLIYKFTSNPINLISSTANSSSNVQEIKYKYLNYNVNLEISKEKYELMTDLLNARNVTEMCQLFGYDVESNIVRTKDGYLLTIQRIINNNSPTPRNGKVIYMHHGLLMDCEIWVTMLEKNFNLPFVLYDLGYDVWLGNNRGNKYSQKHLFTKADTEKFWDFSIDEFALFDIPDTINYILTHTKKEKLTYIGFSQGTAQAFASLSINPELNEKVDKIIAISPATTPHGLYSKFLDILLKSSPEFVYLMFSRRVLMPSVLFWEKIMYPPFFDTSIDISNYLLFNWKSKNISKIQKLSSYAHLYSTTSVKTVVHWFQIMSSKNFQMFNEGNITGIQPISYPLKNIRIPIHLIYGDSDSLVDIEVMTNQLPEKYTSAQNVKDHEHLDNLWGFDVYDNVFSHVLRYLGEPVEAIGPRESQYIETIQDVAGETEQVSNGSIKDELKKQV